MLRKNCPHVFSFAVVIALYAVKSAFASECANWVAKTDSVEGRVEVRQASGATWTALNPNDTICAGNVIRVLGSSRAVVVLTDEEETVLRLDQHTTLTFPEVEQKAESLLDVLKGVVHFMSRVPRALKVKTPYVNAGVEGTEFLVHVDEERALIVVFEGRVAASNDAGSLILTSGEAATAVRGQAPAIETLIEPRDAVQWALYYPPIIQFESAAFEGFPVEAWQSRVAQSVDLYNQGRLAEAVELLDPLPNDITDSRFFTYRASLRLSVGRVIDARNDIDRTLALSAENSETLALKAVIAVVQNMPDEALRVAQQAEENNPDAASAKMALSYALQARFDLQGALRTIEAAVNVEPNNALAWARLAELYLMFRRLAEASSAARRAVELNPNVARTHSVLGFANLIHIDTTGAKQAFKESIALDQAAPLPRLGLGLARIREGDLEEGRREIEIAAMLDPNRALIRSYLGKAYFEEKRDALAAVQYDMAKELDPNDPTAWLYDAIRKQSVNRPVEALGDLQRSIELNDNRAVFRSRLLLDEDQAARSVSLARIYDDLGFERTAMVEATKSMTIDPANHSAHRFLSDSYADEARHEIAKVSELLQSQLLQPININPIQPQSSYTQLSIVNSGGLVNASFNEFTPLFERNLTRFFAAGAFGSNNTVNAEGVLSGLYKNLSYSFGHFHYDTDGFRENNDLEHDISSVFTQGAITQNVNLQAEYRRRRTSQGDLDYNFDLTDFSEELRRDIDQDVARLGARLSWSRNWDIVLSFVYSDNDERLTQEILDVHETEDGYQGEGQFLFRKERINIVAGIGRYDLDVDHERIVSLPAIVIPGFGSIIRDPDVTRRRFNRKHNNSYIYANLALPRTVTVTLGGSYDDFEELAVKRDRFSPKIGLQWDITKNARLRAAAFETVKRALVVNQTIEPTQIAGFNQFFDDFNGTKATTFGVGLDASLGKNLFGGFEFSRRDLDVPRISLDNNQASYEDDDDDVYLAYIYWPVNNHWALRAKYRREEYNTSRETSGTDPKKLDTDLAEVSLRYFDVSGFYTGISASYLEQNKDSNTGTSLISESESTSIVDLNIGYRLGKRKGVISLDVHNLLDERFSFQDSGFRTPSENVSARPFIERHVVGRITFNF